MHGHSCDSWVRTVVFDAVACLPKVDRRRGEYQILIQVNARVRVLVERIKLVNIVHGYVNGGCTVTVQR